MFLKDVLCAYRLYLFDTKYRKKNKKKNSIILKYFYNLK